MAVHVSNDEVVEVIGYTAFTNLIEALGGTEFRVPSEPTPMVIQLLGRESAEALCLELAGFKINIPNGRTTPSAKAKVCALVEKGLKENEIALAIGCTRS